MTDVMQREDGREIKISLPPQIKPDTRATSITADLRQREVREIKVSQKNKAKYTAQPSTKSCCREPPYYLLQSPRLVSGKFQSHHQPTLPNAQWHLIIAHGSRLGSQASTHNSLHV